MSWECPEGCHKYDSFVVVCDEIRTDTIEHHYKPDDANLKNEISHAVYAGNESNRLPPKCSLCDTEVYWNQELPEDKASSQAQADLGLLFSACENDHERNVLKELGLQSGVLWKCKKCGEYVYHRYDVCDACGEEKEEKNDG